MLLLLYNQWFKIRWLRGFRTVATWADKVIGTHIVIIEISNEVIPKVLFQGSFDSGHW